MLCDDLQLLCIPSKMTKELDMIVQMGLHKKKFYKPTVIILEGKKGEAEMLVYGRMVKE